MKDAVPQPIHLVDYRPPSHLVEDVHLTFRLSPKGTRVIAKIRFRANPEGLDEGNLRLDGENLRLISLSLNGHPLTALDYLLTPQGLTIPAERLPGPAFTLCSEVEIDPEANTALEGLYTSNGMFCTQCEAEGFRKITFYPDRPDVMAPFTVRIESDLPVLLSNGNPLASGEGWAEWHDPWPKPAYLFALVAGDLVAQSDRFTTASGRDVALNIWVRPGDEDRCDYAMDALKRSMAWDEQVYGREYDLDIFNIVAVDDFNMGAMENKGLNIFNSKYVLASPETATDRDYDWIEGIVAHEYFHNWTGNRITCRDWFQLCLKEGLTVFRDQQFSADMRSAPVKRIEDVLQLRARQFREDGGPLAHPVRPESYVEINNFYTATVYEKGAELIRMLRELVGPDAYAAALDEYFARHDGQACTIEDWLQVFEDVTQRDLSQFKRWYTQAGTPRVSAEWHIADGTLSLTLRQEVPATPGQPLKEPALIPVRLGMLTPEGAEILPDMVIELDSPEVSRSWDLADLAQAAGVSVPQRVIPSLLRGFSAPVVLDAALTPEDRAVLLAHDGDPFNRWEAGRRLLREALVADLAQTRFDTAGVIEALGHAAGDTHLDPAFRALVLSLPSEDDIAQAICDIGLVPDPVAIADAHRALSARMGAALGPLLQRLYAENDPGPAYSPAAEDAGKRALRNTALRLLSLTGDLTLARAQFENARNMTDQVAALSCLIAGGETEAAARFEAQWQGDRLVMDKWFMLQIAQAPRDMALDRAKALTEHPLFDWKNPNRFRSVIGALGQTPAAFHDPSGAGYRFVADWLIRLDGLNPQTAARMSTLFETWRRYDADRQELIRAELERIAATEGLSRDMSEMVARISG
ncbi:Membrane alanine aminopeptidase N [Roseibacterium elongatum DSM 19469]|uniref:Aminopeptidase N n=1 Tax=Roseicyclus elongatus DSM 19469 TaxID=1294273 RepID=W8S9B9_9RHOB|nr:aminopeptidase N [Roseibacterium elongatum]AHM05581.1 Membrane alanine aminopeptidase N [Roseibacterium elongatum DSM 19469]